MLYNYKNMYYNRDIKLKKEVLIMKKHSVIILESNSAVLLQLRDGLESTNEYCVVWAGDDGDEGVRNIIRFKPDLIIVSMFLKGMDGCGIIRSVKKSCPNTKVIASGVAADSVIERAVTEGAAYYLVKPFSVPTAIERINEIMRNTELKDKLGSIVKKQPVTTEEKISEIFIAIGIPPHIKGYGYLREGIKMTIEHPYIINSVTKELYPSIAKKFSTSSSKVERAIRHAIEVAWNRGRIDAINAIFGSRIYLGSEKPTNSEFIALVADKLILENMV